jgi:EAL domain-containing protein (putative c-di-GMP-specific phosphodiesterase class I)
VARLGGDEFAVLLAMAEAKDVNATVQEIMKALERPFLIGSLPIRIEGGIGIALYPEHGTEAGTLFQRADIALNTAKRTGISYSVYDPAQDKHSPQRLSLMSELHHAIEHDELLLFYQPKIGMQSRSIIGVEALVRWKDPERGLIPPDQFILPAEQTGLIHPMTQWVLNAAMRQCLAWHQAGIEINVSANLSARNLLDGGLPDQITQLIKTYQISPGWMVFEITESAIMADPARAQEILLKLNEMGIRLSIDDFGTGYTSLSYLTKLPVKEIKIDRAFVMNMTKNKSDAVIVRSTIDLAHNLDLDVVAEGVENQEHWDQLASLGCDAAQGYYMGKPMPAADLNSWFKESPWGFINS